MFPLHDNNPTTRWPLVTITLILINVASFIWLNQQNEIRQQMIVIRYGFIPERIEQLANPNLVIKKAVFEGVRDRGKNPVVAEQIALQARPQQIYFSLVTTLFLHGSWMHLLGNMWFLWLFGNNVEDKLGHFWFSSFYLVGGLLATFCHWAYDPHSAAPVIGASGAIAAVLGAYAITFPHAKVKTLIFLVVYITIIELPAYVILGFWFATQLFQGINLWQILFGGGQQPAAHAAAGVAWWAHIGGFSAGLILMPLLTMGTSPPGTDWRKEAEELFR